VDARPWVIWTSELSPFGLKLILLCRHARLPFRVLPGDALLDSWRHALRRERLVRGQLPLTWPVMTDDDEFPVVPYLFGPDGENLYDSTAIAAWLDRRLDPDRRMHPEDPETAFVTHLIDDYADELGLYLVHHNRWVLSARDNDAGTRVGREFRFLTGPFHPLFGRWFAARQTRRLPYLFSVAPEGFRIAGLPPSRQPPARAGFPPTHALLDEAFARLLTALEALLATRPFVLGERLTLADAALYGQLAMNLSDPSADRCIRERAPRLHEWLTRLHRGDASLLAQQGTLRIDGALAPLLAEVRRTYVPLMRQNAAAYERWKREGERHFNERAFDAGRALYDGEIDGRPFRAVAKSFQARVWRERVAEWHALPADARGRIEAVLPSGHGIGG
jgi:glutathione S-transferase